MLNNSSLEMLEARIAPASVLLYTDVDGDQVKITSSKGQLEGHATFVNVGEGVQLQVLDLTDDSFAGTNLLFTVKRGPTGDGFVNVGFIDAEDNDLGKVMVKGDLGRIVAGDSNHGTAAIKLLQVRSMGMLGNTTQGGTYLPPPLPELFGVPAEELMNDILPSLSEGLNELLVDGVGTLPEDTARSIAELSSNIYALLGEGGADVGTLLLNITRSATDLAGESEAVLGTLVSNLLDETTSRLDGILDALNLDLGLGLGLDLGGLLGLDLGGLFGIDLGGSVSFGDLLEDLGDTLLDVTGNLQFNLIPSHLSSLITEVGGILDGILNGGDDLTQAVILKLSNMQSGLTSFLGHPVEGATATLTDAISELDDMTRSVLGTADGVLAARDINLASDIKGNVNMINVATNIQDVFLNIDGNLKFLKIGGSLIGDGLINGGQLSVSGNIGNILIGKNIIGGSELNSGSIVVGGKTNNIMIKGSIIGGMGAHSGSIYMHSDVKFLSVRHDITGSEGAFSSSIMNENGKIGKLRIGCSLIAGQGDDSGTVRVSNDIGSVFIGKSVMGDSEQRAVISAGGLETKNGTTNRAIGNVFIKGSVQYADILGGYGIDLTPVNGDAQIGNVFVNEQWFAGNILAGVEDTTTLGYDIAEHSFSAIAENNTAAIVSKIASIHIRGAVFGTVGAGDHYGFAAEQIAKVRLGKNVMELGDGPSNDWMLIAQATGDVEVEEVTIL